MRVSCFSPFNGRSTIATRVSVLETIARDARVVRRYGLDGMRGARRAKDPAARLITIQSPAWPARVAGSSSTSE